jgi:hypothetical protein
MPHSYCNVCHDVLYFTCSSCFLNTDERIHAYCRNPRNPDTVNYLEDKQKLIQSPQSSQLIMDDDHYHIQNQLNDAIKYNSINLSTSYWNNMFESIKLLNRYWSKIFNIGIDNSPLAFQKDRLYYT